MTDECKIVSGSSLREVASLLQGEPELYVIYDKNVAWIAGEATVGLPVKGRFGLESSEERKTLDTIQTLCRQLMEAGASRNAFLLAVGGGITTDVTGFAAAIYKRGIRYANLPTTLLAQVDAAIGGKTGVNLDGYKNMVGAFRMPEFTFLCAEVLKTLPPREFRDGLAEMLKSFLIGDAGAYTQAVSSTQKAPSVLEGLQNEMEPWIVRAAQIKAEIVAQDPQEHGIRAKLNLGHTFGHAIEHEAQLKGEDIHHGEAVAMGMILAARLAENIGVAQKGLEARLKADFKALGLPTECPYSLEELAGAMEKDKKAAGGRVRWILPVRPGQVIIKEMTVKEATDDLR